MSFFISDAYAAAAPAAQQPGMEGLIFPIAILVFFYFLFLRPQAQRAKEKKTDDCRLKQRFGSSYVRRYSW